MQSDNNQLYKITAERTKKSEATYKDVGNFIFKALSVNMRKPKSLILKLKGVGFWYLRRQRMEIHVDRTNPDLTAVEYEEKEALKDIFKERLKEYDQYIKERNEIRDARFKAQSLDRPVKGEDESKESSQDNLG
jgi:hypothetical protein